MFARDLAQALEVEGVETLFRLISDIDAQALPAKGMQLELHTHRYEWRPHDAAWNAREPRDTIATSCQQLRRDHRDISAIPPASTPKPRFRFSRQRES